jgi:prepilin-type processing-associated H-X9-DG protein
LDNTEANRQAYRQLLLTTAGLGEYISGAILFEETLYQSTTDGKKFVDCLKDQNIMPGIKVDKVCVFLYLDGHVSEQDGSSIIILIIYWFRCRVWFHCLDPTMNHGAKV